MSKEFGVEEHRILNLFSINSSFNYNGQTYNVINSGKPTCSNGEPKTDIYVYATSAIEDIELKISFKKSNADFLENKMSSIRAEQLFGDDWSNIIKESIKQLEYEFINKPLIYIDGSGHTEAGSITLGWKFELVNKSAGQLSNKLLLSHSQLMDIYAGTNLSSDKQNAYVNNKIINNSGIANYILYEDSYIASIQDAIDNLIPIDEFINDNSDIYFACKALNYRTFANKWDGNRPLSVYVNWYINHNKLDYELCFDEPLIKCGNEVANNLIEALNSLGIKNTNDLNASNVANETIVNGTLPT